MNSHKAYENFCDCKSYSLLKRKFVFSISYLRSLRYKIKKKERKIAKKIWIPRSLYKNLLIVFQKKNVKNTIIENTIRNSTTGIKIDWNRIYLKKEKHRIEFLIEKKFHEQLEIIELNFPSWGMKNYQEKSISSAICSFAKYYTSTTGFVDEKKK